MFKNQGFEAEPVDLQVSFGKGDKVSSFIYPTLTGTELTLRCHTVLDKRLPHQARRKTSERNQTL